MFDHIWLKIRRASVQGRGNSSKYTVVMSLQMVFDLRRPAEVRFSVENSLHLQPKAYYGFDEQMVMCGYGLSMLYTVLVTPNIPDRGSLRP